MIEEFTEKIKLAGSIECFEKARIRKKVIVDTFLYQQH